MTKEELTAWLATNVERYEDVASVEVLKEEDGVIAVESRDGDLFFIEVKNA